MNPSSQDHSPATLPLMLIQDRSSPVPGGSDGTQPMAPIDHSVRYHQTFPQAEYLLPSDAEEKQRLELQHQLLATRWDGKLIAAPVSIEPNSAILDIGTGSAAWLMDVSKRVEPTVSLRGMDIEAKLFPAQFPRNVAFSVGSALDMPSAWTDTFDLVHQRLLIAAFRRTEWPLVMSQIFRILKPGAWVQLAETGKSHLPGPQTLRHQALLSTLFSRRDMLLDCTAQLPSMLIEAGFVDVRAETRFIPLGGVSGADARRNFMGVFRGMKTPVLRAGGLGFVDSEAAFDAFMDAMEREWEEGATVQDFTVFVARKPET